MFDSGCPSGFDKTSSQPTQLSRRTFLLGMTSLLALGLPPGVQAQSDFAPFSFAFVSDIHLCSGLPDNTALLQESQLFLQDVVKQLNMRKLDFVIFGGDQIEGPGKDDAYWNLFIDCLQILNAPWYFILGEADISGRSPVDKMVEFGPDLKGRGLTNGHPYWSADPVKDVHIIGLDTSRPNTTTGDLSSEQLNWLKSDLAANKGKFTMAFSHHPLLAPPPYDGGPPWDDYMVVQGASAREILAGSRDVRLCVSGHVPINKIQQEGGIWYVSASTVAIYPCQFKIFTVSPEAVHVETLQVNYDALVKKAKKIMETSRLAFQYSSTNPRGFIKLTEGDELDRNALLPLVSGAVSQKNEKKKKDKKEKGEKSKKEDKEAKSEKTGKSDKSEKTDRAEKAEKSDKSEKSAEENGAADSSPKGHGRTRRYQGKSEGKESSTLEEKPADKAEDPAKPAKKAVESKAGSADLSPAPAAGTTPSASSSSSPSSSTSPSPAPSPAPTPSPAPALPKPTPPRPAPSPVLPKPAPPDLTPTK
ncbi:MAG: metallophosphoesterase [Cyanobacteria bacterium REEB67]|nr:metallophosphoesterase [Cyanobacteria bacterium REEB67]